MEPNRVLLLLQSTTIIGARANHMISFDAGHLSTALNSQGMPQANGQAGAQVGTMLGQAAVVLTGEISLADAAEELSFHMAEKAEDKHHAERKIKGQTPPELLQIHEIVELLNQARQPNAQEKLKSLAQRVLAREGAPAQLAAQAFPDVSQQYLGLQYALREGERQGADPAVLEEIRDTLADMELESGPQIRAGLNSLQAAGAFAENADGVADFQKTYRDVLLGESGLARTLELALERFGDQDVGRGLKHLILALGHDLASARPSTDTNRLQALVQDLFHLEVAVTVLEDCSVMADKLAQQYSAAVDAGGLMRELVAIANEKWVAGSRFTALADKHGVFNLEARVVFQSGLRQILKDLPVQVFADSDTRHSILSACQDALDTAIDEEEA